MERAEALPDTCDHGAARRSRRAASRSGERQRRATPLQLRRDRLWRWVHVELEAHHAVKAGERVPQADGGHQLDDLRVGEARSQALEQAGVDELWGVREGDGGRTHGQLLAQLQRDLLALVEARQLTARDGDEILLRHACGARRPHAVARRVQAAIEHGRPDLDELLDALLELSGADDRAQVGQIGDEDLGPLGQGLPGVQHAPVLRLAALEHRSHLGRRLVLGDEGHEGRRRRSGHRGRTWTWPSPPTDAASHPAASSRKSAWGSRSAPKELRKYSSGLHPGVAAQLSTRPTKIEWSPPGTRSCTSHTKLAMAWARIGGSAPSTSGTPANLSSARRAKRRASTSSLSPSTLTAKRRLASIASCVGSRLSMQTSSSTGSSDSEQTALAVIPAGRPWYVVVTTVTPVAKWAIASRKAISSTVGSDIGSPAPLADASAGDGTPAPVPVS